MLEKYPQDVKVVHKNFPLSSHRLAIPAAMAALAADRQGKFHEYHKSLMASYNKMSEEVITQAAQDLKLDMERFESDRKSPELQAVIRRDFEEGREAEVRGIPTVFINGKRLKVLGEQQLTEAVEKTLKEKSPSKRGEP